MRWWGNLDLRAKKLKQTKHLVQNTQQSQTWLTAFPNVLDRQIQTILYSFFPNGRNLSIAEVKSNTLHLTVPVIHLQEINCQALKHFSSWVILGTFINSVAGSQHFCLVFLLVVKHCSSFYVATFIYIFNNRIINFLLPLSWWPFFSLSSLCFLHVSAAASKWEAALDCFERSTTFCSRNMILGTDKAAVRRLFHRCTWHNVKPFSAGNSWNKYVTRPQKNSRLRKKMMMKSRVSNSTAELCFGVHNALPELCTYLSSL